MTFEKRYLEQIAKTLPIGFYLKRGLTVKIDENADCSYFNPMNEEICISVKQLNNVATQYDESISDFDIENDVRCMLYHEVSHALLTPKTLRMSDIINIFEDERIETLCKTYYNGVDFKSFAKRINHFENQLPTSAKDYFYQIVRFRVGKQELINKAIELIVKYAKLNHFSGDNWKTGYEVSQYRNNVYDFYREVEKDWEEQLEQQLEETQTSQEENQEDDNDSQTSEEMTSQTSEEMTSQTSEEKDDEQEESQNIESDEIGQSSKEQLEQQLEETLNEVIKDSLTHAIDALGKYVDLSLQQEVEKIILQHKKTSSANSSAINAYSGIFDARSAARKDCKMFVQQNREGHVKRFAKLHLNLFIDVSGSFKDSEDEVNKLLYALTKLEQKTSSFSFDLVTCAYGEELKKKNERQIKCGGGNWLDDKIFGIFKSLQHHDSENINIVLFDGDAFSDVYGKREQSEFKNFGAFNLKNCCIISDYDNEQAIKSNAQNAKLIFTRNYVNELRKNVLQTLQTMLR